MLTTLDALFLQYDSKIAHYPLQAPLEYQEKFSFIEDDNRRTYAAMVSFLDDQIANITGALKAKGMWDNTLMVLTSDNGGYVKSPEGGCNYSSAASPRPSSDVGRHSLLQWGSRRIKLPAERRQVLHG